uniref:Uncharacterized protein n=1 Tax=Anguilla anguilla TaxID=7936 RepID=A0A0E9VQG6_ANGAN
MHMHTHAHEHTHACTHSHAHACIHMHMHSHNQDECLLGPSAGWEIPRRDMVWEEGLASGFLFFTGTTSEGEKKTKQ